MTKLLAILALILISLIGCRSNQSNSVQITPSNVSVSDTPLSHPQIEKLELNWAFINRDIKWEAAPKEINPNKEGSLNSKIAVFYPTGKFALVGCTIYRFNKTNPMSISAGDDFSVAKGTWKQNDDGSITTITRLTHSALRDSPQKVENWIIRKKSTDRIANELEFNGEIFIPLQKIEGFDQLSPMIEMDNQ